MQAAVTSATVAVAAVQAYQMRIRRQWATPRSGPTHILVHAADVCLCAWHCAPLETELNKIKSLRCTPTLQAYMRQMHATFADANGLMPIPGEAPQPAA